MSKIIGATVGTPINPEKLQNTEIQDAVNKYLDENPPTLEKVPLVEKLNIVTCYEDILDICKARTTRYNFLIYNQGDAFDATYHIDTYTSHTVHINNRDIHKVYITDGVIKMVEYCCNQAPDDNTNYMFKFFDESDEHCFVVANGGGTSVDEIVTKVLNALPTWEGGSY